MIKKADIILLIAIVIIGIASTVLVYSNNSSGSKVIVTVDGETYGTYSLSEDQRIEIRQGADTNVLIIKDGKAYMESANCKNQICVNHSPISKTKQVITCLPHKVLVTITGEDDYDVVS
ncbi:MAG: NusG domain II-containing protein [Clostridia bacterium]|nr:NusG domain II-containing protein [Clostridia bacterium]